MKIQMIEGWHKLVRAWSMWAAGLGIVLPDLLNLIAESIDGLPILDAGHKSIIRLVCLVAVILLRPIKQVSVSGGEK